MRAPFSSSMPRLAVVAALVASSAGLANALDEESVADNLQPYIGGWLGMYQIQTNDLEYAVARGLGEPGPKMDLFSSMLPNGGISMGVAHGRLHLGVNLGYQLRDGDDIPAKIKNELSVDGVTMLHPSFRYEAFPLDINFDLAMLPNEYPVNFLVGASGGISFVSIQNPLRAVAVYYPDGRVVVDPRENTWNTYNFVLATGYLGARINLARRLNLEGQVGYRLMKTDGLEGGADAGWDKKDSYTIDSLGNKIGDNLTPLPVDLSGAYARVDLRWTFASKAEKERSAKLEKRREVLDRLDAKVALKD